VVLSKKWFSSKNFHGVSTTPLKLTNKVLLVASLRAQKNTFPEETREINLKEKTFVSMVESKSGLVFVWWWSFSYFETSFGDCSLTMRMIIICNLKFEK
jgi:hypothetical protein